MFPRKRSCRRRRLDPTVPTKWVRISFYAPLVEGVRGAFAIM
jgi:hypothetical protein